MYGSPKKLDESGRILCWNAAIIGWRSFCGYDWRVDSWDRGRGCETSNVALRLLWIDDDAVEWRSGWTLK